jgi:hypothetical protein
MKKITFLITLLLAFSISFGQNLLTNGGFESGGVPVSPVPSWSGFKNRVVTDDLTSSLSGQVENGDGSLFQAFAVTSGQTYSVSFDYRWVTSAAANSVMTVRAKDNDVLATNLDITGGDSSNGFTLNAAVDQWFSGSFSVTIPTGVTSVRLLFFKANGNKPLNLDNVSVTLDATASVQDLAKFSFNAYPNPAKDIINLSAAKNIDKIEIYSLLGQQVKSIPLNSNSAKVNVSGLSKGVYLVKTFIEDAVGTYKFIKE